MPGPIDHVVNNDWHGGNWQGGGGTSDWLQLPKFPREGTPAGFSRSPWSSNALFASQQPAAGVSSYRTNTVEAMQLDSAGNINQSISRRGGAIKTYYADAADQCWTTPRAATARTMTTPPGTASSFGFRSSGMSSYSTRTLATGPPPIHTGRRMPSTTMSWREQRGYGSTHRGTPFFPQSSAAPILRGVEPQGQWGGNLRHTSSPPARRSSAR